MMTTVTGAGSFLSFSYETGYDPVEQEYPTCTAATASADFCQFSDGRFKLPQIALNLFRLTTGSDPDEFRSDHPEDIHLYYVNDIIVTDIEGNTENVLGISFDEDSYALDSTPLDGNPDSRLPLTHRGIIYPNMFNVGLTERDARDFDREVPSHEVIHATMVGTTPISAFQHNAGSIGSDLQMA